MGNYKQGSKQETSDYTLISGTYNPKPQTLNPKPQTLNPKP